MGESISGRLLTLHQSFRDLLQRDQGRRNGARREREGGGPTGCAFGNCSGGANGKVCRSGFPLKARGTRGNHHVLDFVRGI